MMPKTIETVVYDYDELEPAAQEKARDWYREVSAGDTYWHESMQEDAQACGKPMGLMIDKIYFSGFSSQGDGACFEGSWRASDFKEGGIQEHAPKEEELHRIAAEFGRIAKMYPEASFSVKHRGHYYHKYETVFDVDFGDAAEDGGVLETVLAEAQEVLIEAARDMMDWIYRTLEKEWDYQNSDEQVIEMIRANDYTFTKEGKRFG